MLFALLLAATVRGPADVESLTGAADVVVRAQVARRSSAWAPGGGQIFTTVVLRPIETWKGDAAAEVVVLVPGGDVGELSQTVQGAPAFERGEEVVVFLRHRAPQIFAVERMSLGKFTVFATPGHDARALRDRRFVSCVGCGTAEEDELSLDELRARVLARARR